MQHLKIGLAAVFGALGVLIIACAIHAAATYRSSEVSKWIPSFNDHGLTPGLVLLCTAVILLFLPRGKG